MKGPQKVVLFSGALILLLLVSFPHWYQEHIKDHFLKDLGRRFLLSPPIPVDVSAGPLGTLPAADYKVILDVKQLAVHCFEVVGITVGLVLILRRSGDATSSSLKHLFVGKPKRLTSP